MRLRGMVISFTEIDAFLDFEGVWGEPNGEAAQGLGAVPQAKNQPERYKENSDYGDDKEHGHPNAVVSNVAPVKLAFHDDLGT